MTDFQLDTSGSVDCPPSGHPDFDPGAWFWSDLDPFTQGYVEALLRSMIEKAGASRAALEGAAKAWTYDAIAPETLATIIRDCAAMQGDRPTRDKGALFWEMRQTGKLPNFPPLTPTLGEDGKVRFQ